MDAIIEQLEKFNQLTDGEKRQLAKQIAKQIELLQNQYGPFLSHSKIKDCCMEQLSLMNIALPAAHILGRFTKLSQKEIFVILAETLEQENTVFLSYINKEVKVVENKKQAILQLTKVTNFLNRISFDSTEQFYRKLLKESDLLHQLCQVIVPPSTKILNLEELLPIVGYMNIGILEVYGQLHHLELVPLENPQSPYCNMEEIRNLYQTKDQTLILETMMAAHDNLVKRIAQVFYHSPVEQDDLMQEGRLGLMRAIQKYDPTKGVRFSGYASTWIGKFMTRYIQRYQRSIYHSFNQLEQIAKFERIEKKLQEKDSDPTLKDICLEMGISIKEGEKLRLYTQPVFSLHNPLKEESQETFQDMLIDPTNIEALVEEEWERKQFKLILDQYYGTDPQKNRRKRVLMLRYGLENKEHKLEEIGQIMNLSIERIRQILKGELLKLRELDLLTPFSEGRIHFDQEANFQFSQTSKAGVVFDLRELCSFVGEVEENKLRQAIYQLPYEDWKVLVTRYGKNRKLTSSNDNLSQITEGQLMMVLERLKRFLTELETPVVMKKRG